MGLSAAGADFGNRASGIYIRRAPANIVEDNIVSGNDGFAGIAICGTVSFCGGGDVGTQGSTAGGNVVRRNWVGLDGTGTMARGNNGHGISIDGAPDTAVGGVEQGNVITAAGVSSGIDMGLRLAAHIAGDDVAHHQGVHRGAAVGACAAGRASGGARSSSQSTFVRSVFPCGYSRCGGHDSRRGGPGQFAFSSPKPR